MCNSNPITNDGAKVIQVIVTRLTTRGDGLSPSDPIRLITQFWSMDGQLLASIDPTDSIGRKAYSNDKS